MPTSPRASTPPSPDVGVATLALDRLGKDPATAARVFHDITPTDTATGLPSTDGCPALPGWDAGPGPG